MMTKPSHDLTTSPWLRWFGLAPSNALTPFIAAALILTIGAFLWTLAGTLFGGDMQSRLESGLSLIAVSIFGPMITALLISFSHRLIRIQDILQGDYLVHWHYSNILVPGISQPGREVYISHDAIYWPAQRHRLIDFKSGLNTIEIVDQKLVFSYRERRYNLNYPHILNHRADVPIPLGQMDEAEALIEKLKWYMARPSRVMNDTWVIAWVMGALIVALVIVSVLLTFPLSLASIDEEFDTRATLIAPTLIARETTLQNRWNEIRPVIEPQMDRLREEAPRIYQPAELGFAERDNIRSIVTGTCRTSDSYYLMVFEDRVSLPVYTERSAAFHYVEGEWLNSCMPPEWESSGLKVVNADWNYVYLVVERTYAATLIAVELAKLTPAPTASR